MSDPRPPGAEPPPSPSPAPAPYGQAPAAPPASAPRADTTAPPELSTTVSSSVPLPPPPPRLLPDATPAERPRNAGTGQAHAPASAAAPAAARARGELIGRFLLVDQLGEGGMGVVYKAYDPDLGRLVAIKRLRVHAIDPRLGTAARLVREAQAVAQLAHPNVVAVYDVGEVGGDVFIAMEYVDGWRLREWLTAARRAPREILDVFAQAAAGLAAAHDAGLVHRDFKPHNVLVGYDGRVRVVDFGLARPMGGDAADARAAIADIPLELDHEMTPAGMALGTPRYMAPEQHLGRPLDGRADQFGFCVALYEAVVGSPPFPAKNLRELTLKVTQGPAKAIPRTVDVPKWLRKLLGRGLSTDPAARYPTMHELVAELRQDHAATRRAALGTERHTEHMLAAFPPPDDDATQGRVRELQRRLERARARKERGLVLEARAMCEELTTDLAELDYLPLRAATAYLLGELRHKSGDHEGARAALESSLRAAAAAGDDWQLAASWVMLVLVVGVGLGRADEAATLALAAELACVRVGENPSLRSRLCTSRGLVWLAAGRARDAAAELERAVAIDEATYGPRHWFVAVSLLYVAEAWLAAGEPALARPALARAEAICTPDAPSPTPTRARCLLLAGKLAHESGDAATAAARLGAAAAAFDRCPGHDARADEARRLLALVDGGA